MSRAGGPLPRATFPALLERAVVALGKIRTRPEDLEWVRSVLTPAELGLWDRLSLYDQDHAVQAARRVEGRLAGTPHAGDPRWLAAALMHDVGKLESNLSRLERVAGTLASKVVSVPAARRWASRASGPRRRLGAYLTHGEIGARMIRAAGGREEVAAWTEVHQGDRDMTAAGLPPAVLEALVAADVA